MHLWISPKYLVLGSIVQTDLDGVQNVQVGGRRRGMLVDENASNGRHDGGQEERENELSVAAF